MNQTAAPSAMTWRSQLRVKHVAGQPEREELSQPWRTLVRETLERGAAHLKAKTGLPLDAVRSSSASLLAGVSPLEFDLPVMRGGGGNTTVHVVFDPRPNHRSRFVVNVDGHEREVAFGHGIGAARSAAQTLQRKHLGIGVEQRQVGTLADFIVDHVCVAVGQLRDEVLHEHFGDSASMNDVDPDLEAALFGKRPVDRFVFDLPEDLGPNAQGFQFKVSVFLDRHRRDSVMSLVRRGTDEVVIGFQSFCGYLGTLTQAAGEFAAQVENYLKHLPKAKAPAARDGHAVMAKSGTA